MNALKSHSSRGVQDGWPSSKNRAASGTFNVVVFTVIRIFPISLAQDSWSNVFYIIPSCVGSAWFCQGSYPAAPSIDVMPLPRANANRNSGLLPHSAPHAPFSGGEGRLLYKWACPQANSQADNAWCLMPGALWFEVKIDCWYNYNDNDDWRW